MKSDRLIFPSAALPTELCDLFDISRKERFDPISFFHCKFTKMPSYGSLKLKIKKTTAICTRQQIYKHLCAANQHKNIHLNIPELN